jgi:hypothetical protein
MCLGEDDDIKTVYSPQAKEELQVDTLTPKSRIDVTAEGRKP